MQKAEVPDSAKSLREHMLKDQPEKPFAFNASGFKCPGWAVEITKRDSGAIIIDDVFLADDTTIQIP